jgi:hypothetical protein
MFSAGEARACPECGIGLKPMSKLPLSHEAQEDEPEAPLPPHMEVLPWTYMGRGRGVLLLIAVLGLIAFFVPWVRESAPELRVLSGFDLAQKLGWLWAPFVAWFVMLPLVASRRSVHKMRGARLAVGFLGAIVLVTVAIRLSTAPASSPTRPVRFEWAFGLYASGALALVALVAAALLGGPIDDLPTRQRRRGDETLH